MRSIYLCLYIQRSPFLAYFDDCRYYGHVFSDYERSYICIPPYLHHVNLSISRPPLGKYQVMITPHNSLPNCPLMRRTC